MAKLSVTDVPVKGKRVLVRVDFNVPLDENLNISDESRILGALPTIKYLVENGAKTILCSHLGRPKGKVVPEMSLAPVAKRLAELLPNVKVAFASDSVGEDAKTKAEQLGEGEVLLLENLEARGSVGTEGGTVHVIAAVPSGRLVTVMGEDVSQRD